jgi:hypothetical protein
VGAGTACRSLPVLISGGCCLTSAEATLRGDTPARRAAALAAANWRLHNPDFRGPTALREIDLDRVCPMPNFTQAELDVLTLRLKTPGNMQLKLDLLRRIPMSPPDGTAKGYRDPLKSAADPTASIKAIKFSKLKVEEDEYKIAFIKLVVATRDKPGAVSFEVKYAPELPTVADRATYIPIWFLPWQSGHMTKLKLSPPGNPALRDSAGNVLPNPDVFFTAAVSGCSVFARGALDQPSVYHGGFDGKLADEAVYGATGLNKFGGTSASFWRQVVDGMDYGPGMKATARAGGKIVGGTFVPDGTFSYPIETARNLSDMQLKDRTGTGKTSKVGRDNFSEINTTHYTNDDGKFTTANSRAFEAWLQHNQRDEIRVEVVSPFGCVFGLRDANNQWSFYLQESVTVTSRKLRKKRSGLRSIAVPDPMSSQMVKPLRTWQFFPGNESVTVQPEFTRVDG